MIDKNQDIKRKPICPYCEKEMDRLRYEGYYDTFDFWDCECLDDIPIDAPIRGGYP